MLDAALLACALSVHPVTLDAVVRVESRGNPIALHVNGLPGAQPHPASVTDAAATARAFIAAGYNVDIGLMQVNSRNLPALGFTLEEALDPCRNVSGGARILAASYQKAVGQMGPGQPALLAALSAYNTGNFQSGFQNGYLAKYWPAPALQSASSVGIPPTRPISATTAPSRPRPINPYMADILVSWSEAAPAWSQ